MADFRIQRFIKPSATTDKGERRGRASQYETLMGTPPPPPSIIVGEVQCRPGHFAMISIAWPYRETNDIYTTVTHST